MDIFEDDAAEGGFQGQDRLDEAFGIRDIQLEIEHVDIRQPFEKDDHSLLDRFGGLRPDVAQIRYGRAIGNDSHQVGARGVAKDCRRVFGNGGRGEDGPGQVGKPQLKRGQTRFGGPQFDFAGAITFVVIEGVLGSDHKLVSQSYSLQVEKGYCWVVSRSSAGKVPTGLAWRIQSLAPSIPNSISRGCP